MKRHMTMLLAGAALVVTTAVGTEAARASNEGERASSNPFVGDVEARAFTVNGTVVSTRGERLVVRIDDHRHHLPFSLGTGVSTSGLRAGTRVTVRYHPSGSTGQVADEIVVRSR